jgi:hypothetical protein
MPALARSLAVGFLALAFAQPAGAVLIGFDAITANNVADVAVGESQLFVDVTDAGGFQVLFTFSNTGPAASSITDVYFDDGTLLGIASIINGAGVAFSLGASPPNLPSGENAIPPFQVTSGFAVDSDPPTQANGVNPGETLGILFDLQAAGTFADVLDDLDTGALRIGIHVQGFAGGGSESFVNDGPPGGGQPIPEPTGALLFAAGSLFLATRVRRGSGG